MSDFLGGRNAPLRPHACERTKSSRCGPHQPRLPAVNGEWLSCERGAVRVGGQGAGVGELLAVFDAVRAKHEGMAAEAFNDDATYKGGIIQVEGGGRMEYVLVEGGR
jgi:hypothetical protein